MCRLKIISQSLFILIILYLSGVDCHAYNTAGSMLHVDPSRFNHPNLTKLTWTAKISEYDLISTTSNPYRLRIEFNSVGFMGNGTGYPYTTVGAMIQNTGHRFLDEAYGTISTFPALGLYLSSLEPTWSDSLHGVYLNTNPNIFPLFGRCFENVDAMGYSGKNIYTRTNMGTPTPLNPITVRWTVSKGETAINPSGNFSKNSSGAWVPLIGTFVKWNFKIEINNTLYDVADYFLPITKAEYIWAWDPLTLHQEYFGSAEGILDSQKGSVQYTDMKAFDGTNWHSLADWEITWKIDDEAGNLDNRYGWKTDGTSLISSVGHQADVAECVRNAGAKFSLQADGVCGDADGKYSAAVASYNLCSSGTASTVTGSGPWSWRCTGINGGANSACSALYLKPGDCDTNGTVTIAEVQSGINMFLGLKTAEACVDQDGAGGVSIAEVQKVINEFLGL